MRKAIITVFYILTSYVMIGAQSGAITNCKKMTGCERRTGGYHVQFAVEFVDFYVKQDDERSRHHLQIMGVPQMNLLFLSPVFFQNIDTILQPTAGLVEGLIRKCQMNH